MLSLKLKKIIKKIGWVSPVSKALSKAEKMAKLVDSKKDIYQAMTDEQLKEQTTILRSKYESGNSLRALLPDAYAIVREMAKRRHGMFAYHVQLVGASIIAFGDFAEMATGEGKTLTIIFPIYLNALTKKGIHVVSVNEYLVERDAAFCRDILEPLGVSVGYNLASHPQFIKKAMYACDVTYTTNSELGFDYLRDNMVKKIEDKVQRGLNYAIIDEGDSVLIDEARTPLIISGSGDQDSQIYKTVDNFAKSLNQNCYEVDRETRAIFLTSEGVNKAQLFFNIKGLYDIENSELVHRINNALIANFIFIRGVEYIVTNGEIRLVDQSIGRIMEGRSYSNGLHQAIQAKENVEIEPENLTVATITYQSFFRLYNKLSALSGTAVTESEEFMKIYNMLVVPIPTNRKRIRTDLPDSVFSTKNARWRAVVDTIKELNKKGQPVLVGTSSVEDSEELSHLLSQANLAHEVLNARQNQREAEIISKAGQIGSITISTSMAGRGTDIKLGPGVKELGGLFVVGANKAEARRIDNQLRGRSGRQGDPGMSKFFISTEDTLFKRFAKEKLVNSNPQDAGEEITSNLLNKALIAAQKRVEGINFDTRKNLLDYDQVLAQQRELIYKQRDSILGRNFNKEIFIKMTKVVANDIVNMFPNSKNHSFVDENKVSEMLNATLFNSLFCQAKDFSSKSKETVAQLISKLIIDFFEHNNKTIIPEIINAVFRDIMLNVIDNYWQKHLDQMTKLKDGIQLRSMEQSNPLNIYVNDGDKMFQSMLQMIAHQAVTNLVKVRIQITEVARKPVIKSEEELKKIAEDKAKSELASIKEIGLEPNKE